VNSADSWNHVLSWLGDSVATSWSFGLLGPGCSPLEIFGTTQANPPDLNSEWQRTGAALSDKTARKEFGLTQDEIVQAIRDGKLRPGSPRSRNASQQLIAEQGK
jgi:hypothetical protein